MMSFIRAALPKPARHTPQQRQHSKSSTAKATQQRQHGKDSPAQATQAHTTAKAAHPKPARPTASQPGTPTPAHSLHNALQLLLILFFVTFYVTYF